MGVSPEGIAAVGEGDDVDSCGEKESANGRSCNQYSQVVMTVLHRSRIRFGCRHLVDTSEGRKLKQNKVAGWIYAHVVAHKELLGVDALCVP